MKRLLKSTLYLFVFAAAGILFQISCSADSSSTNSTSLGKIVYTKKVNTDIEIWTCNYDGTNQTQYQYLGRSRSDCQTQKMELTLQGKSLAFAKNEVHKAAIRLHFLSN